jgi:hypothetical protein
LGIDDVGKAFWLAGLGVFQKNLEGDGSICEDFERTLRLVGLNGRWHVYDASIGYGYRYGLIADKRALGLVGYGSIAIQSYPCTVLAEMFTCYGLVFIGLVCWLKGRCGWASRALMLAGLNA